MQLPIQNMVFGQKKVAGSIVGGRADMQVGMVAGTRARSGEITSTATGSSLNAPTTLSSLRHRTAGDLTQHLCVCVRVCACVWSIVVV